jgi:hypothetical protein
MRAAGDAAERRFVREALLSLGAVRPGLPVAAGAVRSWERVLHLARAGSVAESVWAALSLRDLEHLVPEPVRSALADAHVGAAARNALLLSEAASAQEALEAAGIPSVVLKGPGLLVAHYPDIGARHMGDVDLLVRKASARRADQIIRERGAREKEVVIGYDGKAPEVGRSWDNHLPLLFTASGAALELHFAQPGEELDGRGFDGLLGRSREVEWQGRRLRIPSAADLAAGASIHVFGHHHGEERFLPRALADLAVTVGRGAATWEQVRERAFGGEGAAAVASARKLLAEGPPGAVAAFRRGLALRVRDWARVIAREARSPVKVARVLFPAPSFMALRYGVPERSLLLPALYVWRPIRGLWKVVSGR